MDAVLLSEVAQRATQSKDPDAAGLTAIARTFLLAILLFAFLGLTHPAHAQGCAQCLDSTRATPPAVQAAYRHAIELLGSFGVALFLAALYLLHREP
jgi:hypothetical protein